MSSAFLREVDDLPHDAPPELKISTHPNWVTSRGLKLIEETLGDLEARIGACEDEAELAWLRRDQRYWAQRRATAQLVEAHDQPREVAFGARVTIRRGDREPETVELVGEDEADPQAGRLSWVAPLARALMGAEPGDVVELEVPGGLAEIEVLQVEPIRRPH